MEPAIEVHGTPEQPLGMSPAQFLQRYWQKRPLLIRQAFPSFEPPLQPDDLGGLACEESALSRLIRYDRANDHWTVHTGPLEESLFARLPDRDWTVLVQDVDKWDEDVARLLADFRFLPSWRVDDVMISYAEDGGGVGAHVDQYDVFLIQGLGQRRWSIDANPHPPTAFRDDVELKLLRQFTPSHTWVLDPGDVLYLPPGVPHDGVAIGPCMTFSIGMRAPSRTELLLDFSEYLAERLPDEARYCDADLAPATAIGQIDATALARVRTSLGPIADAIDDAALLAWFGPFITRYRSAQWASAPEHPPELSSLLDLLAGGHQLVRHPWTRLAWGDTGHGTVLYAAGETMACSQALAERLCGQTCLGFELPPSAQDAAVLEQLVRLGHLVVQQPPQ